MKDKKIGLIGGHLTPALAVGQKLSFAQVVFFGRVKEGGKESVESATMKSLGIKFVPVWAVKFHRFFTFNNFLSCLILPFTILAAIIKLIAYPVDIVIGFGGYLSLPMGLAAKILGKKLVIYESTQEAGLANKILKNFADKIIVSFSTAKKYFPGSYQIGFLLRKEILEAVILNTKISTVFIAGGHLGSRAVNSLIKDIIPSLLEEAIVIHQTGKNDFAAFFQLRKSLPPALQAKYVIKDFFPAADYASYLANCTVFVGRSGINTVAEVLFFNKPAVFIPFPFGQKNEQLKNARFATEAGRARIVSQQEAEPVKLLSEIRSQLNEAASGIEKPCLDFHNQSLEAAENFLKIITET